MKKNKIKKSNFLNKKLNKNIEKFTKRTEEIINDRKVNVIKIIKWSDFIKGNIKHDIYENDLFFNFLSESESILQMFITSYKKELYGIEVLLKFKNNPNNFYYYPQIDYSIIDEFLNREKWIKGNFKTIKKTLKKIGFPIK